MKKILKRLLTLFIIINFIGIFMECSASGNSTATIINNLKEKDRLESIKEKGIITVGAPSKEIPFFYKSSENNEVSGIDADIIIEIAKRLGIDKVEIKEETFANLLEKFNSDDSVDVAVGGIFITPESEKLVAFSKPLYKESEEVIVPKYSRINFMNDLNNAVVGVEKGTIFESLAKKWKENNIVKDVVTLESTTDLFNAINNGNVDAGLADSIIINYHLLKVKDPTLRILKDYNPELEGIIGIAIKKNDISLLNSVNKIIDDMKADGTLYAILVKNGLDKNNMIVKE